MKNIFKTFNINSILVIICITIVVIIACTTIIYIQKEELRGITINDKEFKKVHGKIAVYISGAVNNSGIFYFNENTKLEEALNIIGGVKEEADLNNVNLSKVLNDSEKIVIPYVQNEIIEKENENIYSLSSDEKININNADESLLMTLPGIGEVTARKIIEYRKNGNFESIEEIKKVPGIGDSKFEKIKDKITVE
jgi:competence protein ComEA